MKSSRLLILATGAAAALSLTAGSLPASAAPAASSATSIAAGSHTKAERLWATKFDTEKNSIRAQDYVTEVVAKHGVNYVHAHKTAIIKGASKWFSHFSIYKGSVKMRFTSDRRVLVGPDEYERYLKYTLTVRNDTDKVAYAVELNTHSGSDYKPHKVKY